MEAEIPQGTNRGVPSQKFMGGPLEIMGGRGDSWENMGGKPTHFIFGGEIIDNLTKATLVKLWEANPLKFL